MKYDEQSLLFENKYVNDIYIIGIQNSLTLIKESITPKDGWNTPMCESLESKFKIFSKISPEQYGGPNMIYLVQRDQWPMINYIQYMIPKNNLDQRCYFVLLIQHTTRAQDYNPCKEGLKPKNN